MKINVMVTAILNLSSDISQFSSHASPNPQANAPEVWQLH